MKKKLLADSLLLKIGVGIWLIHEGKVLLGERAGSHGEGTWAPPGGHLEFGETPFQTAKRELKEETDLDALELLEGPWTNDIFPDGSKHYVSVHVLVTDFSGELKLTEPDKCRQWKWFPVDDLPPNLFFSMQKLLEKGSLTYHLEESLKTFSLS